VQREHHSHLGDDGPLALRVGVIARALPLVAYASVRSLVKMFWTILSICTQVTTLYLLLINNPLVSPFPLVLQFRTMSFQILSHLNRVLIMIALIRLFHLFLGFTPFQLLTALIRRLATRLWRMLCRRVFLPILSAFKVMCQL